MKNDDKNLDLIFHALADATRRDILDRLAKESISISKLSASYDMSLAAVSKHVKVLEKANLVTTSKEGRIHRCTMNPVPLENVTQVVRHYQQFWEQQLQQLEGYVDNLSKTKKGKKQ